MRCEPARRCGSPPYPTRQGPHRRRRGSASASWPGTNAPTTLRRSQKPRSPPDAAAAALAHPACPPSAKRLDSERPRSLAAVSGPYGSATRRGRGSPATRYNASSVAADKTAARRAALAADADCPQVVLDRLARDPDPDVRRTACGNARTPARSQAAFVKDPSIRVRTTLASSRHAGRRALKMLAADTDDNVRGCVASNARLPIDAMRSLVADPARRVRGEMADNLACAADVLDALACDDSPGVRLRVVANPNCGAATLVGLCADTNPQVAVAAALHPMCPPAARSAAVELHGADALRRAVAAARRATAPMTRPRLPAGAIPSELMQLTRRQPLPA